MTTWAPPGVGDGPEKYVPKVGSFRPKAGRFSPCIFGQGKRIQKGCERGATSGPLAYASKRHGKTACGRPRVSISVNGLPSSRSCRNSWVCWSVVAILEMCPHQSSSNMYTSHPDLSFLCVCMGYILFEARKKVSSLLRLFRVPQPAAHSPVLRFEAWQNNFCPSSELDLLRELLPPTHLGFAPVRLVGFCFQRLS